ncbi:hybrid sensor histidine kinase/response regulator [Pseudomonas allokribbensis]|uniref:hybrid sensor histidine kinase/response regulator n=1 Tax=Pseudomonas allokribbensis TaxID=2774460 RepID=UPI0017884072|nr:hybrid sensor histidine kinase/response regulator [Pseudomonas allokribbensis]
MKSIRSNLRKLSRSSLRFNFILLSSFLLTIFFFGASYWAIYKVLETQRIKVYYHYFRMIEAIHEHELFLLQVIRSTSASYPPVVEAMTSTITKVESSHLALYEVAGGARRVPAFSLVLPDSVSEDAHHLVTSRKLALGMMLSNFHNGFWNDSPYSAPQMFLLDLNSKLGMAIPAIERRAGRGETARNGLLRVVERVSHAVQDNPPDPDAHRVYWRPGEAFLGRHNQEMLAYVSDRVPDDSWVMNGASPRVVAATLFEFNSVYDYSPLLQTPIFDSLDLISPDGVVLLGSGSSKSDYEDGIYLTWKGLLIKRSSGSENSWHALYHVGYQQLFQDAKWQLLNVALLLITCVGLGWLLLRWQRQNIVKPADQYYGSLVSRNEFSQGIIQATPVALCVIKESGRQVVMQNSLALQWLGEQDDLVQLTRDWHMFEDGSPVYGEACAMIGSLCLHARFAPTTYQGEPALLCAFIDITAHKEAESELVVSRNKAHAANAEKSRFLATMSHEIRTPLYGVVGTLELLGLTHLSQQQEGYLRTIKGSSSILLQLISDILDLSKIEAGEMSLDPGHFAPLEVVEEALRNYSAIADGKGLILYSCVDTDLPGVVLGDGMRVRQIINNLLSNAIKFTQTGRVTLHLNVLGREEGRVRLQWQIIDTGVGISKEQQVNLFEPFFQASNQPHASSGAGLGLSICFQLSQMMQGTLEVVSAPGLGSSFSFEVELQEVQSNVQLPEVVQAGNAKIHVRSPAPEFTSDICQWLEMSVGNVVAWDEQTQEPPDRTALLLELLPESLPPVDWQGPRIVAGHDASVQPLLSEHSWRVNVHSRLGVTHAVMLALGWPVTLAIASDSDRPEGTLGLKVLLAEDHPVNQALLTEQLEQLGCSVTVVGNGQQALEYLEDAEFDVVLTDVNMPVMDGYEFAERLRLNNRTVPIVAVSANALREEGDRCIAAGMNAWLTKPISLHALFTCLRKVTEGKTVRGESRSPASSHPDAENLLLLPERIRTLFVSAMEEDLDAMRVAMGRKDSEEIIRLLHRIRGALSVARVPSLVAASREIETALKEEGASVSSTPDVEYLIERLQKITDRLTDTNQPVAHVGEPLRRPE